MPHTLYPSVSLAEATPDDVSVAAEAMRGVETAASTEAEVAVAKAWEAVEAIMARNTEREELLATYDSTVAAAFTPAATPQFWTARSLGLHFGLVSIVDKLDGDARRTAHIHDPARNDEPESDERYTPGGARYQRPPAHAASAPLRRVIGNVLRENRETAPKEFTLLFRDLGGLQEELPPIEEKMTGGRFALPLQLPFQHMTRHVAQCLIPTPTAQAVEESFADTVVPKHRSLLQAYQTLDGCSDGPTAYSALALEQMHRRRLYDDCVLAMREQQAAADVMKATHEEGRAAAAQSSAEAIDHLRAQVAKVVVASEQLLADIDALAERGEAEFHPRRAQLETATREHRYKLERGWQRQERAARRAREALKELAKEQLATRTAMQDYTRDFLELHRLTAAHLQFKDAVAERRELLTGARTTCDVAAETIAAAEAAVQKGFAACELHARRMATEEHFRRMRIATHTLQNLGQWHRSLLDLTAARGSRLQAVEQRMQDAWQLEFLLRAERDDHASALELLAAEQAEVEATWTSLRRPLLDCELAVPVLEADGKRDPAVVRIRRALCEIPDIARDASIRAAEKLLMEAGEAVPPRKADQADAATRVVDAQLPKAAPAHVPRPPTDPPSKDQRTAGSACDLD